MAMRPIGFEFVAAGVARRARVALTRMKPSQVNTPPSWAGYGMPPNGEDVSIPITDPSFWEGRYKLTEITLRRGDNSELRINDATVNISREKRVVRTSLTGLEGTVKEYIGNGDYDISITVGIVAVRGGVIVDEYPEDGIGEVRTFLDENQSMGVTSTFFKLFNIKRMVITRFSLRQETHSNRQVIEINALSDVDYEIKDTEY